MSRLVLVVDDNHDDRTIIVSVLRFFGYVVVDAPDAIRGLKLAKDWRPAIAIVDLAIPGFSGTDMAAAIRTDAELQDMPLIAISAHPEYRTLAERIGFDLFLAKPFASEELLEAIQRLIEDESMLNGVPS